MGLLSWRGTLRSCRNSQNGGENADVSPVPVLLSPGFATGRVICTRRTIYCDERAPPRGKIFTQNFGNAALLSGVDLRPEILDSHLEWSY
eukprot:scaffold575_cov242-Pinguiococcus_pyrenoidosus.AAC.5